MLSQIHHSKESPNSLKGKLSYELVSTKYDYKRHSVLQTRGYVTRVFTFMLENVSKTRLLLSNAGFHNRLHPNNEVLSITGGCTLRVQRFCN